MNAPTRVLMVESNDDETVGGSHRSMFELIRSLDAARYEPIVCFHRQNPYVQRLEAIGVRVIVLETERARELDVRRRGGKLRVALDTLRGIAWRYRLLRRERAGLVHINSSPMFSADDWLPAARLAGVPIISMERGDGVIRHPRIRWLAGYFDRIIAVSDHVAEALRASSVPATRVTTVYNGIDAPTLIAEGQVAGSRVRAELGIPATAPLVLMVANIRRWKGQHVVLQALTHLPPALRSTVHLIFVGGTASGDLSYAGELRETVQRIGASERVRFLGWRDDIGALVSAADVALHASITPEPFGRVVVEALAVGTPVIASSLGGPAEIITPDCGRLFDPTAPETLAAALVEVLGHPATRQALSEGARRRALRFSVAAMAAGVTAVYDETLRAST